MSGTLIARGVLEEVKLVIVLRIKPFSSLDNLGSDPRAVGVKVFLLHLLSHSLGDIFLNGRVVEDGRAILWEVAALKPDNNDHGEIHLRVPWSFPCLLRVVGSCVR